MQSKHIGIVSPLLFEDKLLISLSKDWINSFSGIPEFIVSINNKGQLSIVSLKEIKDVVV